MGIRDYVLGLECGNNYLEGRDDLRKRNLSISARKTPSFTAVI